jgi:hypothetical protein
MKNDLKQKKMKGRHGKSRHKVKSFFEEFFLFFIKSFLYVRSYIRRIILFFVHSDDHQPTVVYPSLKNNIYPLLESLILIIFLCPNRVRMMFVSKYLLKLIIPIAMWIIKFICLLQNLLYLAINLLYLVLNPLMFNLELQRKILNP